MAHFHFTGTAEEAVTIQKSLASSISLMPLLRLPKLIAGADISLERFGTELFAGIIVLAYPELTIIDSVTVRLPVSFPYIPGLLSFREIPGLLSCYEQLRVTPDLIVVDGQGIAHPRKLGIATHLGLILDVPTIGCAKSRLYGNYIEPERVGESSEILDPKTGDLIGFAYKSKARSRPLLISPGNKITAQESLEIIKLCIRGYRLPEPTRLAHRLVNEARTNTLKK